MLAGLARPRVLALLGLTLLGCVSDHPNPPGHAEGPGAAPTPAVASGLVFPFPLPFISDGHCDYCQNPVTVCRAIVARAEPDTAAAPVLPLVPGDSVTLV